MVSLKGILGTQYLIIKNRKNMTKELARYGWDSDFPMFHGSKSRQIRENLSRFVEDASESQIRAWDDSIPQLQNEVGEILARSTLAKKYEAILEYELPMESRRTDVIFLAGGGVVVLELKGKTVPSQADIDQAAAYGRDLRCYHRECSSYPVHVLLVPTRARGFIREISGTHILGPDAIDEFVADIEKKHTNPPPSREAFLAIDAYRPLPTIVQAARELMQSGKIRPIHRARAATEPAINEITKIIHEAAATRTRRLILVTGVPGAGKTLVGLQIVHSHFLDDLAVPRDEGMPTAPAVFLSGNGPLVQVLQYELRGAGGGGRVFIRGVKDYVKRYSSNAKVTPPEHVLVYDEAQRAFDAEQVRETHKNTPGFGEGKSEPEHFIEFAERIPEWCVVIGLIGSGQEIHIGEEGGLVQWRHAVEGSKNPSQWKVHTPSAVQNIFNGSSIRHEHYDSLNLDTEIRFHLASDIHKFVGDLLTGREREANYERAKKLNDEGYHLRITRDINKAKEYLKERYQDNPDARYGLLASSKDKDLLKFGINNDFQSTKRVQFGPWYGDKETYQGERSCRHLKGCVTEFGAQGLELDAVLLAWGTDFIRSEGKWSNDRARGYRYIARIKDPFQLRLNAYRVLLTRGRDANVVFVPEMQILDETFEYLVANGFTKLE